MKRTGVALAGVASVMAVAVLGASAASGRTTTATRQAGPPVRTHRLFMRAAREGSGLHIVTLPAFRGRSGGKTVWFVVTDASSKTWARRYGANYVPKLANAANTAGVMRVTSWGKAGGPVFPFTPNFSPRHVVAPKSGSCPAQTAPGPPFLPAICFSPGAVGFSGGAAAAAGATGRTSYSPLVQLDTDQGIVVLDAPQIANSTGRGDKVLALREHGARGQVDYVETTGMYDGHTIHYASFDASDPLAAALEGATWAPALGLAPNDPSSEDLNTSVSSRAGIIAFTNGPTSGDWQGLNAAIALGRSPLNVIQSTPDDTDAQHVVEYSPLWDVHLATWRNAAAAARDGEFVDIQKRSNDPKGTLTDEGPLRSPGTNEITGVSAHGSPRFAPTGFDVNCPIISTDPDGRTVIG
jgi:hypothetical protein